MAIIKNSNLVMAIKQTEVIPVFTWKKIIELAINKIKAYQENIYVENILHNSWIKEYEAKKNGNCKDKTLNYRKLFNHKSFLPHNKNLKQFQNITQYKEYTKDVIIACGIIIQAFTDLNNNLANE